MIVTTTPAKTPPDQQTDEATAEGLKLARQEGDVYHQMVKYFVQNVAVDGALKPAGEYIVGFSVEHSEPLYFPLGNDLKLVNPADDNAHLEVVVMDAADHRFVPELTIYVTVREQSGTKIGTYHLPFLWHPTMYHYGADCHVPEDGQYDITIEIDTPRFPRHDKVNGKRYTEPVTVAFTGMTIKTGRK
jgi:hypothetical protein